MRALVYKGPRDVAVEQVPDAKAGGAYGYADMGPTPVGPTWALLRWAGRAAAGAVR
ncbi:MAG TPA: hypothetical protein VN327_07460 [Pseudonocardiaceae bacterium]|nr:hypothetical protein [Pseudonocardiaceae bacterium]